MKKAFYIIIAIVFIFICWHAESFESLAVVNILSLVVLGYGVIKQQNAIVTPFNIIISTLYLFHTSHLWLSLFHGSEYLFMQKYFASGALGTISVFKVLTILLILFFIVGVCFLKPVTHWYSKDTMEYRMNNSGKQLIIILYVISFYFEIQRALSVYALGYGEGYHYGSSLGIYISNIVQVLLLLALYVYRNDRKNFLLFSVLVIIRSLFIIILIGNRGKAVMELLMLLFIATHYATSIISKRKIGRATISLLLLLIILLPFISLTRGDRANISVGEFISSSNPVESFLEEFGGTVGTVILSDNYVSERGSFHGAQILSTTLTIVPGSTFLFGSTISKYASFAGMLNEYNSIQGLGGSMLAQLILNFGYSPFLYISLIAMALLSVWLSNRLMSENNISIYRFILLISLFLGLLINVRGEWYETVSQIKVALYIMLALYLIQKSDAKFIYTIK